MSAAEQRFRYRVLVVDDEESIRTTLDELLTREGYDVLLAADGFEALATMRGAPPDLVISDLKMPNMSGFEFLGVVRKRFPSIAVIAISGEFRPASLPADLLVDRYLEKGITPVMEMVETVRELLASSPIRSQPAKADLAAVWVPRSQTNYLVLTCPECLRSFSVRERLDPSGRCRGESCPHCSTAVQYCVDANFADETQGTSRPGVASRLAQMHRQVQSSSQAVESSRRLIRERSGDKS